MRKTADLAKGKLLRSTVRAASLAQTFGLILARNPTEPR